MSSSMPTNAPQPGMASPTCQLGLYSSLGKHLYRDAALKWGTFFCCYVYLRHYFFGQQVLEASSKESLEQGTGLFEPGRSRAEPQKNADNLDCAGLGRQVDFKESTCSASQSVGSHLCFTNKSPGDCAAASRESAG